MRDFFWYWCYNLHWSRDALSPVFRIFIESANWADRSSSWIVCLCVCLCVCLFVPLHVVYFEAYFAPTSLSRMSKVFRASESLGKMGGKKWSQNWTFFFKVVLNRCVIFLLLLLILPYKTWWKPRFPMDWRPLVKGYIANFGISLDVFEFFGFWLFFLLNIFFWGFCVFLVHPTVVSVLLSALVERFNVFRMRDFLKFKFVVFFWIKVRIKDKFFSRTSALNIFPSNTSFLTGVSKSLRSAKTSQNCCCTARRRTEKRVLV